MESHEYMSRNRVDIGIAMPMPHACAIPNIGRIMIMFSRTVAYYNALYDQIVNSYAMVHLLHIMFGVYT